MLQAFKSWWYISLGVPTVITVLLMVALPLALTAEHFTLGNTLGPRSLDHVYIAIYYTNLDKTAWTYSKHEILSYLK